MSSKLQAAQKTDDNAIFPHSPTGVSLAGRDALLRGRLFRGGLLRLWFGLGVLPAVLLTGFGLARALLAVFGRRYNPRTGITLQTSINNIPRRIKQHSRAIKIILQLHIQICTSIDPMLVPPMNDQTP